MKRLLRSLLAGIAAGPVARAASASLVFALSISSLAGVAYADQYFNSGVEWGGNYPSVKYTNLDPLGINTFLEKEADPAVVRRSAQMVRDGGYGWVRQGFAWNDIEISAKGNFIDGRNPPIERDAWEKYDHIVNACRDAGLEIIARLDSPPVWARIPGDDVEKWRKGPPANYEDYGDFVYAVASRYRGKIKYFQIWNEPNLWGEWGGHPVSPEQYTELLKVAYRRAKEANPEAVIITAALAPTAENSLRNVNDILFLEGMYRAGAGEYFDIVSTMIYGLGQPPGERRTDLKRLGFSRPILLRDVMERYGDWETPIWISEYNWISLPPDFGKDLTGANGKGEPGGSVLDWGSLPPGFGTDSQKKWGENIWGESVAEETQARWLVEGYRRARSEWPWLGVMAVWNFREPAPNPAEPATYFSIVRPDFTPRPAYNALRDSAAELVKIGPAEKPLWNSFGFPLAYGFLGLLTMSSGALAASSLGLILGRWTEAVFNRPRGRYSAAARAIARESARNGAAIAGMALLVGIYYSANSLPLMLAALALWGLLAFLKPSTGLAAVAFSIPFFWLPKELGQQHFPIAETLLALVFGAVLARRAVALFLPSLALKLSIPVGEDQSVVWGRGRDIRKGRSSPAAHSPGSVFPALGGLGGANGKALVVPVARIRFSVPEQRQPEWWDELAPAEWPVRPVLARTGSTPRPQQVHRIAQVEALHPSRVARALAAYAHTIPAIGLPEPDGNIKGSLTGPLPINKPSPSVFRPGSRTSDRAQTRKTQNSKLKTQNYLARFRAWQGEDAFAAPAVALLIIGTLSLLVLADPAFARDSARAYRWTIVEPVLFYFLLTETITSRRGLLRVTDFFVAAAVGLAFLGVWQYVSNTDTLVVEGVSRVMAVYQHPNNFALYLGRLVPFAACLAFFLPWGRRKLLYGLSTLPLGLGLLLTYSRGAWVAVVVAIIVAVTVGLRWRPYRDDGAGRGLLLPELSSWPRGARVGGIAAVLLVLVAVAAAVTFVVPRLPERIINFSSGSMRVSHWQSSAQMIADHPIFGVGPDQFLNQFQARGIVDPERCKETYKLHPNGYIVDERQCDEYYTAHPHNLFLDYWLSLGIMGLIVLLWLLWRFGREALAFVRRASRSAGTDPIQRALILGLLAGMVNFLVHGLVDNSYFLMDLALIFWLFCGMFQISRQGLGNRDQGSGVNSRPSNPQSLIPIP